MKLVRLWNKRNKSWYVSGNGRDSWGSVGKVKAVMKTSYFPDYRCEPSDYEFVIFDLVESSRESIRQHE